MKVILQRDIPKLGKMGDIVPVKAGYARNYLLPRALAVTATGGALKEHEARAKRESERDEKNLSKAQTHAEKIEGLSVTILGRVGGGTKLYGSITAQDVADAIKKERGIDVDKRRVGLVDPIKTLGSYTIAVRLHSDITVPVSVEVTTEEELARRKAQAEAEAAKAAAVQAAAKVVDDEDEDEDEEEELEDDEAREAEGHAPPAESPAEHEDAVEPEE